MSSGRLSRFGRLSLGVFVVALIAEHVVERGLSPTQHMISEYANTGAGAIMGVGFAAWSASWLLLALAFSRRGLRLAAIAAGWQRPASC